MSAERGSRKLMMTADKRQRTKDIQLGFFWTGVVMAIGCIALVLAKNTGFGFRFENASLPMIWVLSGVAILEFLAAELCQLTDSGADREQHGRLSAISGQQTARS